MEYLARIKHASNLLIIAINELASDFQCRDDMKIYNMRIKIKHVCTSEQFYEKIRLKQFWLKSADLVI